MTNTNGSNVPKQNEAEKNQAQQANSGGVAIWPGGKIHPDDINANGKYIANENLHSKADTLPKEGSSG